MDLSREPGIDAESYTSFDVRVKQAQAAERGIDAFVDEVVPLLQERGLFHKEYEGKTLREYAGAPDQYGIDPRVWQDFLLLDILLMVQ